MSTFSKASIRSTRMNLICISLCPQQADLSLVECFIVTQFVAVLLCNLKHTLTFRREFFPVHSGKCTLQEPQLPVTDLGTSYNEQLAGIGRLQPFS